MFKPHEPHDLNKAMIFLHLIMQLNSHVYKCLCIKIIYHKTSIS